METPEILLNNLKKGKISPLYIFSGEEEYLKEKLLEKIERILIDPSLKFFNYEILDGEECDADSLIIKCRTVPFFSTTKLIVVKNADKLCSSDELTTYIQNPPPGVCLILFAKKVTPQLKRFEVRLGKLHSKAIVEWIRKKIWESKKGITFEVAQYLLELAGEDLRRLSSEIEKLVLFVGEKPSISKEDVQSILPSGIREMDIFDFVDTIGNRNKKEALRILQSLILTEDTGKILGMIARQFRLIIQVKELMKKNYSQTNIAQQTGLKSDWVARRLLEQAKNFSIKNLINKLEILLDSELSIKTSRIQPLFNLEIMVSKLCVQE